jgi:hypothetical protein
MANNWRYYQETGQAGGTTTLQYVDSFNGDDANSGAYNAPKQTIQGAVDASANNAILILAGYFSEGDIIFPTFRNHSIYCEGNVVIDGLGKDKFVFGTSGVGININDIYQFGSLEFKNFTLNNLWVQRTGHNIQNVIFNGSSNNNTVVVAALGIFLKNCIFINTTVIINTSLLYNCTFINSSFTTNGNSVKNLVNCFFDENSKVDLASATLDELNYNCILGTDGGGQKIRVNNVWYSNTEALQAATSFASNDLPSTTLPAFNLINPLDYTLQAVSPLARAGKGKIYIGAYGVAKSTESENVVWTATGIDNTTTPGEAVLTASPTGTLVSSLIQVTDKVRRITRINMPDFEIAPSLGETIGRLASDRTPYAVSVEIQYSINGSTTNGTWLRVPVGTQPLHDTVNNVGNDDATFDVANAVEIFASHIQYRVTMRDNETPI